MKKIHIIMVPISFLSLQAQAWANSPLFSIQDGDGFKRFAVSAGWLHVMPQSSANNFNIQTAIKDGQQTNIGDIRYQDIADNAVGLDPVVKATLKTLADANNGIISGSTLKALGTSAKIGGLHQWTAANTGLKVKQADTLGLMADYYFTDHISLQAVGGYPPTAKLKGVGTIYAPLSAHNTSAGGLISFDLNKNIMITNLEQRDPVASVRAWTPALNLQYHFGKTGVNKFRPYIGVGAMYAWFDHIKLNADTEKDLINAGHMVQNVKDGQAGAALAGLASSSRPYVKIKTDTAWAPFATAGFSYDFNDRWFSTASISYAPLKTTARILVINNKDQSELIRATSKVDINPVISYIGLGYRF